MEDGDRVLLYGGSFIERLQESGNFEAMVRYSNPDKKLEFRSLAWSGDEVGYRLRPERYVNHLKKLLEKWPADVVILGFGMNESFAGESGLERFRTDLAGYIQEIERRHPDAQIVVVSPIAAEDHVYDLEKRNQEIAAYAKVMEEVAGGRFVDLFELSKLYESDDYRRTDNGIQLNADGSALFGKLLAKELLESGEYDSRRVPEIAKAVSRKAKFVSEVVRPVNTVLYFGVRGRANEYEAEIPRYHQIIEKADSVIQAMIEDESIAFDPEPLTLEPLPRIPDKDKIATPAEIEEQFVVADGFAVNLFASEEDFPELRNPEQIAFDEQGRLWVVTMPSFPGVIPGEAPDDQVIVLEDTDRDGKADKSTVFAGGLNVPDGIAFHEDGVIVSHQPKLVFMRDEDGDGKADYERELLRGIDVTDAHHGGMIAMSPLGHVMFCDGVFHRSQLETPHGVVRGVDATTYRLDLRTGKIDLEYQTLTPNPWKITWDRWGNLFQMYGDGFVQDSNAVPWTPFGVYHPFKRAISIAYGKGSAAQVISSPNFPDDYQQGVASAVLLRKCFVSISKQAADQGYHRGSDRVDVLASPDTSFRPVDIAFGFDGAMYISDFASRIIGHAQNPMRDPRWDGPYGRIWRVVHTEKPVVKDWPDIVNATPSQLLDLLEHPQDNIRDHARRRLRNTEDVVAMLDTWLASKSSDERILEGLRILNDQGEARLQLLEKLLESPDHRFRAAGVNLIRFQSDQLTAPLDLLKRMTNDPHPRVRVAVIHAVSYLQRQDAAFASILGQVDVSDSDDLKQILADASHGVFSGKSPEVPVLEIPQASKLTRYLLNEDDQPERAFELQNNAAPKAEPGVLRTFVDSPDKRRAILSIKHSYVKVFLNGVPVIASANWWSSESNAQVDLQPGVNEIRAEFIAGRRKSNYVPLYLFNPLGAAFDDLQLPKDDDALIAIASAYDREHRIGDGSLRISAVPNQFAFSPAEVRIAAGETVNLIFDNPDHQIHNLLVIAPGTVDEIGLLADQMAQDPQGMSKHYVPDSDKVLWATPLVNANEKVELEFNAPTEPGRYPIVCTFPGHWRVMKGVMIVE
ncbi:MAG: GDSL-type esterase/lipase family protein [Verrucomicrobiota bacterium]